MPQTLFIVIVSIVIADFILERFLDFMNARNWSDNLPSEIRDFCDAESYKKSMNYDHDNQRVDMISSMLGFVIILFVLFFRGFAALDTWVRHITTHPVWMSLLFFAVIAIISDIISTPFSVYNTFVVEEKYGFNKTTVKTYILDKLKGWLLGLILGGLLISLIVWIYTLTTNWFWLFAWIAMTLVMIFLNMFYSSLIVPLFNKQTQLPAGELRDAIESFCRDAGFRLKNIFVIDGSKRSSKANAYFSGLGAKKRIVLYDTLIHDHPVEELVAVLAHEIGHYKLKHTLLGMIMSVLQTGLMLYIISLFIGNPLLSESLGVETASFHIGITAFGLLFTPVSLITGLLMNWVSRKNEYAADAFAAKYHQSEALKKALIRLSVKHLSNLKPHPVYVFFHYSHPTLLQRIRALDIKEKG